MPAYPQRPPDIFIASSNIQPMPALDPPDDRSNSGDSAATQPSTSVVQSSSEVDGGNPQLQDLMPSLRDSQDLSAMPPPVIVHSATKTLPFVNFEVNQPATHPPRHSPQEAVIVFGGDGEGDCPPLVMASTLQKRSCGSPTDGSPLGAPPGHQPAHLHGGVVIPHKVLLRNLTLFVLLKVLGSFDSGAFSATLNGDNGITEDWGLSVAQQGTLSSSVFLGNMIGCAIAGHLFSIYSAKMLLIGSLIIHGFFTFLFASSESYEFALLCRFFIGVTLAFIVVYTPVWVDEFAPKSSAATWMALQNAGVPLGIMLGFVIGGLMPTYTSVAWEWAFFFKTIAMVPIVAMVAKTDARTLNSSSQAAAQRVFSQQQQQVGLSSGNSSGSPSTTDASPPASPTDLLINAAHESYARIAYIAGQLLHNGVYVANMLSLSSLYFVVSGLQTFVTSYLRAEPFNASMDTIVIGFGCAVVTAPVFGVVCGGVLLDRIGGYHGNIHRASKFALMWGVVAAVFSVVCIFIHSTKLFLIVVWFLLFCGGAIIPPGSGINMASLPEALRPSGSSVSQMAFNFLGNFSGPLVCGWIAEWTGSLTWGVRALFGMGVVGVLPMSACMYFARRRYVLKAHAPACAAGAASGASPSTSPGAAPLPLDDFSHLESLDSSVVIVAEDGLTTHQHHQHSATKQHHHRPHYYAASNVSIIGALEEIVEADAQQSPRNSEEDHELIVLSRNGSIRRGHSRMVSSSSRNATPSQRLAAPLPMTQLLNASPLDSSTHRALQHQSTQSTPQLRPHQSFHSPHRSVTSHHASRHDAELIDNAILDSGNFNLSFPNQISFGLDVVRGILEGSASRSESRSESRQMARSTDLHSANRHSQQRPLTPQQQVQHLVTPPFTPLPPTVAGGFANTSGSVAT